VYPEDLDVLKNNILNTDTKIRQVWTYFYHFLPDPFRIQVNPHRKDLSTFNIGDARCSKDNIFRFSPKVRWTGKVHEHVTNLEEGIEYWSQVEYLHVSYCRKQWATCLKWLHYGILEHGHVNNYKFENIEIDEDGNNILDTGKPKVNMIQKEYFRDWRHVDNILWDRLKFCHNYPNDICPKKHLPEGFIKLLGNCKTESDWIQYINKLDGNEMYEMWLKKKDEVGEWSKTLDWIVEECEKQNWNMI
jgi:hypothetical protein